MNHREMQVRGTRDRKKPRGQQTARERQREAGRQRPRLGAWEGGGPWVGEGSGHIYSLGAPPVGLWASPVQGVRKEVTEREVSRAQGVGQEVEKLIVGRQQPQPTEELPIPPKEPQSLYYGSHLLWGTAPYFCGPGGH